MKSIFIFLFLLIALFKSDCQSKGPVGEYKVEFYDNYTQGYIITFRENNYSKTNSKGETIGKGEIDKYLRENGEGIIHLKDYAMYIPAGKIDKVVHKTFSTDYTEFWFTEKDTIQFGIHHENSVHISFQTGRMIKLNK
ncbi:hypothetical protein GKZ90_0005855 [Flavobacterium sp. MC2016-06]|jgi:hypothetical protein|uniref:hypothetical protein n=1 Tax=Flavobacterium sp. MC2016-06 TaxID=2676308 RepID=UPI0012BA6061|nr:hypothetical protein [Flavobacterium sp. MC2016-06]MBU3857662.1 hypothetical protein [Flavobacterium sp. MC2016-06]